MFARLMADAVVLIHFAFIVFVILGGLLALRWRWVVWLHIPAAVWGALIEFANWTCPLTPLENWLHHAGGEAGYAGSFVEQYLLPVIYPAGLTREVQIVLGTLVCVINISAYFLYWRLRPRAVGQNIEQEERK